MSLTDKNLYAYCDNNPVMRVDYGGEFWETAAVSAPLLFKAAASLSAFVTAAAPVIAAVVIVTVVVVVTVVVAEAVTDNIEYAKTKGKENQRDTGLIGVSDDEIADRLKDPNTSKKEKQRLQKEQKARGNRNKNKRRELY